MDGQKEISGDTSRDTIDMAIVVSMFSIIDLYINEKILYTIIFFVKKCSCDKIVLI